jgi:hypothetical protein
MHTRAFCLVIVVGVAACSSSSQFADPVGARPSLESCRDAWDGLTPINELVGFAPRVLRWHDGSLYYRIDDPGHSAFVTIADTGGEPTDVSAEFGFGLWIEGETLVYSRSDQLYEFPLPGGPSMLVSDGEMFGLDNPMRAALTFFNQELDASSLYWVLHRSSAGPEWSLWRMPRAGGRSEQIAILPDAVGLPSTLVALPDQLLIAGRDGQAYVSPKDGGDVRELPSVVEERDGFMWSRFLGAAQSGVAWAVAKQASSNIPYDIVLVTPEGEMMDRWPSMPAGFVPDHAWWDDSGRWVISGTETFTDGDAHTSIWSLDAEDHAKRLACDARSGRGSGFATVAELTDDFAYLVVSYFHASDQPSDEESRAAGWRLVKIEL